MDSRRGQLEYKYDPVGRLLAATGALGHEVFAFDPASNIVSPDKRGTKLLDNLLKDYAGTHYEYDERGNLIRRTHNGEVSTFEWDAFNRMVKATTPQGVTTFAYDPLGRRIAKHGPKAKMLFGWDGDVLAFESSDRRSVHYVHEAGSFVPLAQATRRGPIALTASVASKELMGANGRYDIDRDPLWNGEAEKPTGPGFTLEEIAFYQVDHLGTPQELTDHEGNVAWAAQYKAWGQAREVISDAARKAGISNPIRFQGQYWDEETGLHYNRYRYYDPHAGRFASKDPTGLLGGSNLQEYAPNSTEWVDPLGLKRGQKTSAQSKDGATCPKTVTIYRVVDQTELNSIRKKGRYSTAPSGWNEKQFWLNPKDAEWFAEHDVNKNKKFLVSSKICQDTLDSAHKFQDAGHNAVSFSKANLWKVNRDARNNGGIVKIKDFG